MRDVPDELKIDLLRESGLTDERVARWKRVITGAGRIRIVRTRAPRVAAAGAAGRAVRFAGSATAGGRGGHSADACPPGGRRRDRPGAGFAIAGDSAGSQVRPVAANRHAGRHFGRGNLGKTSGGSAVGVPARSPSTGSGSAAATGDDHPAPAMARPAMRPDAPGEEAARRRRRGRQRLVVGLIGYVVSAGLGLSLGYWLLCIISPQSNVLKWSLPWVTLPAAAPGTRATGKPANIRQVGRNFVQRSVACRNTRRCRARGVPAPPRPAGSSGHAPH